MSYSLKYTISLSVLLFCNFCVSQIHFEEALPPPPNPQINLNLVAVADGSIAYSDIDGDGDLDLMITGGGNNLRKTAELYQNDSNGNYTLLSGMPFEGVEFSSIGFSDIDGDSDDDILLTGLGGSDIPISKLYTNDGSGNFVEQMNVPFEAVSEGSIGFSDVNGDGFQDVLITGKDTSSQFISKLYFNDGSGVFTEASNFNIDQFFNGSVAFEDIDNDGDDDLLITGFTWNGLITKLYANDSNGNFTEISGLPFIGVRESSTAFADVDGDGDQDVLITGQTEAVGRITKLYINNGNYSFNESSNQFYDIYRGSVAFSDIENDGDEDIVITGSATSGQKTALYLNDGNGNFIESMTTIFKGSQQSRILFFDINGDTFDDLIYTGFIGQRRRTAIYINENNGSFNEVKTVFDAVTLSEIAFSDIDGDNDEDVIISGLSYQSNPNVYVTILYENVGNGFFDKIENTPFSGVYNGTVELSDIDGDNDKDVLITGQNISGQELAELYENDGNGNFTLIANTPFEGVKFSSTAFSDVDNDGDNDVLITGQNSSFQKKSTLYLNDGNGNFSEDVNNTIVGVDFSSIAFSDLDNDGDQDLLVCGGTTSSRVSVIYTNDGAGNFTIGNSTSLVEVRNGDVIFFDIENDGDDDLFISGENDSFQGETKLYRNDGNGNFSLVAGAPFDDSFLSSVDVSDVDEDNDLDLILTGVTNNFEVIAKLYINDGSGNFTESSEDLFIGAQNGDVAFSDSNLDGKEDLLITGFNNFGQFATRLYLNLSNTLGTKTEESLFPSKLIVYPNPSSDNYINLFVPNLYGEINISIYTVSGKKIYEEVGLLDDNKLKLNLDDLSRGIYLLEVIQNNFIESRRIIVD